MRVISFAVINGRFSDEFGKRGTEFLKEMPIYSIPFSMLDAPTDTKSFAFVLEDPDAVGGNFVHWLGANIQKWNVEENESINAKFIQGVNDWYKCNLGISIAEATRYGGMAPPDKEHTYVLTVYALDSMLNIESSFKKEELIEKMEGHILDMAQIKATYAN